MTEAEPPIAFEIAEVLTVGFPFCVFKGLVGAMLWREGHPIAATPLLVLCVCDTILNLVNLGALFFSRRRALSACTLAVLVVRLRLFGRSPNERVQDLGNAFDMLLSFTLVAGMVGLGRIAALPLDHLQAWNVAVVLNVLGAGLSRVGASYRAIPTAG